MTLEDYCRQTRTLVAERKPQLLRSFDELMALLANSGNITPANLEAIHRLTAASEFLYVGTDWVYHAVQRGELEACSQILYELRMSRTATAFYSSLPSCRFPVAPLTQDLVRLEQLSREKQVTVFALIPAILQRTDVESAKNLLAGFITILEHSPQAMIEVYNLMNSRLKKLPARLLDRWFDRGIDLLSSQRVDEGIDFLRLRSRESRRMLGIRSVVLGDIQSSLRIYATSLSQRSMSIRPVSGSSLGLDMPYSDGRTLFLPDTISLYRDDRSNERIFSAITAMQAAGISMGSYSLEISRLGFINDIRDRYATVLPDIMENVRRQYRSLARTIRERPSGEVEVIFEGGRTLTVLETEMEKFFYMFPAPDLIRELFRTVENLRIRSSLAAKYPGLAEDFKLLDRGVAKPWRPEAFAGANREERFHLILAGIVAFSIDAGLSQSLPQSVPQNPSGGLGTPPPARGLDNTNRPELTEALSAFRLVQRPGATVEDSALAAFRIFNALYERYPVITYCERRDIRADFDSPVNPLFTPEVVRDISPELLPEVSPDRFADQAPVEGAAVDLTSLQVRQRGGNEELKKEIASGDVTLYRYDEYHRARGEYLRNHCTVYQKRAKPGNPEFASLIARRHEKLAKRLKRRFLMLQNDEIEVTRRWEDGDEIHMGDAFDFLTDLARGEQENQKIFQRRSINVRDIAVAILIDASSSTNRDIDGSSILEIEQAAVLLLGNALQAIGDRFAVYAFHSRGRKQVDFTVVKDFDDGWNAHIQSGIGGIEAADSNRDGCAVRHCCAKLSSQHEKTKLLLMLSDGIPADPGYGSRDGIETNEYAIEDTRRAIQEARQQGIFPYCLTIDREAREYIPRLYGDYRYTILDEVEQLPERLSKLYLRLTR